MNRKDAKLFAPLELLVERMPEVKAFLDDNLTTEEKNRLEDVSLFIEGFESPYGLELLATIDFLAQEKQSLSSGNIQAGLTAWSQRKTELFTGQHVQLALQHLNKYTSRLYPEIAA